MALSIAELTSIFPRHGRVDWIGARPVRKAPLMELQTSFVAENGLTEDYRANPGKRAVTLFQSEHLDVVRALAAAPYAQFADLRRNIAVSGINLSATRSQRLHIGELILEITGVCAPCSRMETILGTGGYNAMRGHGGMTAEVIATGQISIGDQITVTRP